MFAESAIDMKSLAESVVHEFLLDQFNDMDIVGVMNYDPDCANLTEDEWDQVKDMIVGSSVKIRVIVP